MILIKARKLLGTLEKTKGLMFTKNIQPIYFETRWGIHTFFVKEAIDIMILDDRDRVKKVKRNLKPFRLFFWNPKYFRILEFPSGFVKKNNIKPSMKLKLLLY